MIHIPVNLKLDLKYYVLLHTTLHIETLYLYIYSSDSKLFYSDIQTHTFFYYSFSFSVIWKNKFQKSVL